jgi:dihydrofolate synthase/folylpolyglutamate synthase
MKPRATYYDILWYMYSFTDYEKKGLAAYAPENYNLERVHRLLGLLGDPHREFQAVHIAGTKGKGSTAAMIESVLRAAGYCTGLYTSPHLHTFRERIQVRGELIPEDDVVRLIQEMRPLLDQVEDITTFEVMTGLAFAWFAEQRVEWAVVEVGLGGRLDATNVLTPAVAVITSISRDHTGILGETVAEIAAEKAGIIKPGVPVVSSPQSDEALAVIEATCRLHDVPLTLVGRDWMWEAGEADLQGQTFSVSRGQDSIGEFGIPLLGTYQASNATTALAALSLLEPRGVILPPAALRSGLSSLHWPGRLEILGQNPLVVVDSAHNGDSAHKLVTALRSIASFKRFIIVLGASSDHVTPGLLQALLGGADRALATATRHPRAASPSWIRAQAAELGFEIEVTSTVPRALDQALAEAGPEDLICCTGSVFVAAEARAAWFERQAMSPPPSDPS